LIPDVAQLARLEIARDERRLAGARRRAHPDDWTRQRLVEQCVEPWPWQCVEELGARQLGESGRADGHGSRGTMKALPEHDEYQTQHVWWSAMEIDHFALRSIMRLA